jgi:hypothetical protein
MIDQKGKSPRRCGFLKREYSMPYYKWHLKLRKAIYLLMQLLAGFMTACTADMVLAPGAPSHSQYAPINEAKRPGIIKYLNQGAQAVRDARREDAYKQMHSACDGTYRIIREGTRSDGGAVVPFGDMTVYAENQYVYIEFECVGKMAGDPAR